MKLHINCLLCSFFPCATRFRQLVNILSADFFSFVFSLKRVNLLEHIVEIGLNAEREVKNEIRFLFDVEPNR